MEVVIVGAGFGGLAAAKALDRVDVHVTLVDRHNYHTFQPLLYQVATAGLDPDDIAHSVRGIYQRQANVDFRMANVTGVDWDARHLTVEEGDPIPFDQLVLAAGAATSTFGIPGVAEHAFPLKTLEDALRLRNHVLRRFELADAHPSVVDDGGLTFVVAGGGPTGVELSGAFVELFSMVLAKDFRRLDVRRARVVLIEMTDHLLGQFHPVSRRRALETLRARGVDVMLGAAIEKVTPTAVQLSDGELLAAHTLVWSAGIRASPLADALGLPQDKGGRVIVNDDLSVAGHPEAFVVGDLAAARDANGELYPQLAQVAIQQAKHAARQIRRRRARRPPTRFRYRDRGIMATIGRNAAVAELPLRIRVGGFPAWAMWLGLHIVYLIGFRNRVSVLVDWSWNYLTWDRGARLIMEAPPPPPTEHFAQTPL